MIITFAAALACALAGALARRIAGGLFVLGGTQRARALAAALLGGVVLALSRNPLWAAGATLLAFHSYTVGFPPIGMVPRHIAQAGGISQQHGWPGMAPFAVAAAALGLAWWPFVVAAAWCGCAYWLATLWQPHFRPLQLNPDGLPDPPPLAELYYGAAVGLALFTALWGV